MVRVREQFSKSEIYSVTKSNGDMTQQFYDITS